MKKDEKLVMGLICMIAIGIVSLPLFGGSLFAVEGHDAFFHTQRIWSIKNALEAGQFPVRIYKEIFNGQGYAASLYYPDLFLYFPAILCLLGLPLAASYNIFMLVINALTMFIAFYSFSKITDSAVIGLIAALLYELCSYRMLDVYTRASVGEVLALMFCPLALCGLHLIAQGAYQKWWILALGFSGLLQSHILTFVLMAVVAVVYVVVRFKVFLNAKAVGSVLLAATVTILLNLWFLIPFFQASQTKVIAMINNNGFWSTDASLAQIFDVLLLSVTGTESWTDIVADVMPKTPGITLILGAILAMFSLIMYRQEMSMCRKQAGGYLVAGLFATLMITKFFPWKFIEKVGVLNSFFSKYQFIWRFNVLAVLFLSIAAAYGIYYFFVYASIDYKKTLVLVSLALCSFAMIFVNQYTKHAGQYVNDDVIAKGYMDIMYVVPGFAFSTHEEPITSNYASVQYTNVDKKDSELTFDFEVLDKTLTAEEASFPFLEVALAYYPGYRVLLDGEEMEYDCGVCGIVRIRLPKYYTSGTIEVQFVGSGLWTACEVISVLTAASLLGYFMLQKRKKKQ